MTLLKNNKPAETDSALNIKTTQDSIEENNNMSPITKVVQNKLKGFDFWRTALNSAKFVVAPMVDQSEYAWRKLTRKYDAQLCYTPMINAKLFSDVKNETYRKEMWAVAPEDRPLIVQFCANDPQHLLNAAKLVENDCDGVDLNLGCPQHIARRGHYGSFLQDEWELIEKMVRTLDENLAVPVTCKIRIFPEVSKTIAYAQMLERAGCQLLTVHGRLREQKGHNTGIADWEQIKQVKQAVKIPVFANGNVLYFEDVQKCLDATGVEGIMSAEGTLYNPAIFSAKELPLWEVAEEYMKICLKNEQFNKVAYTRAHLFKLYKPCLSIYTDLRDGFAKARTVEDFGKVVTQLNDRLKSDAAKVDFKYEVAVDEEGIRTYPHWICQPYIRPPNVHNKLKSKDTDEAKVEEDALNVDESKVEEDGPKAVKRKCDITAQPKQGFPLAKTQRVSEKLLCPHCPNIASAKCPHLMCKQCCKTHFPKLDHNDESTESLPDIPICEAHHKVIVKEQTPVSIQA